MDLSNQTKRKAESTDNNIVPATNEGDPLNQNHPPALKKPRRDDKELTDLSDSCLDQIFKHLSIADLISISQTSQRCKSVGRKVFETKYSNKTARVSDKYIYYEEVQVNRISFPSIALLKVFGDLIKKLNVQYKESSHHRIDYHLESAIAAYCRKSLIEIALDNIGEGGFHEINDVFENVKRVQLNGGFGACLIRKFNRLFPNATDLELFGLKFNLGQDSACVHQTFKSVTYLAMLEYNSSKDPITVNTFTVKNVKNAVMLNPQLKSLMVKCKIRKPFKYWERFDDTRIDEFIHNQLPQLEALSLNLSGEDADNISGKFLNFPKLKRLSLTFGKCQRVPYIFSQKLESFQVALRDEYNRRAVMELISLNKSVRNLEFLSCIKWDFPLAMFGNLKNLKQIASLHMIDSAKINWIFMNCKQFTCFKLMGPAGTFVMKRQ